MLLSVKRITLSHLPDLFFFTQMRELGFQKELRQSDVTQCCFTTERKRGKSIIFSRTRKTQDFIQMYAVVGLSNTHFSYFNAERRIMFVSITAFNVPSHFKFRAMGAVTAQLHGSFVARTIPEWNRLPAAAADAVSPTSFHSRFNALPVNFWPCGL